MPHPPLVFDDLGQQYCHGNEASVHRLLHESEQIVGLLLHPHHADEALKAGLLLLQEIILENEIVDFQILDVILVHQILVEKEHHLSQVAAEAVVHQLN